MHSTPETPHLTRALGVRDVALFMVTAGCSVQWATSAAAAGPSSLLVWVFGGLAMFLPLSVLVVCVVLRGGGVFPAALGVRGVPVVALSRRGRLIRLE